MKYIILLSIILPVCLADTVGQVFFNNYNLQAKSTFGNSEQVCHDYVSSANENITVINFCQGDGNTALNVVITTFINIFKTLSVDIMLKIPLVLGQQVFFALMNFSNNPYLFQHCCSNTNNIIGEVSSISNQYIYVNYGQPLANCVSNYMLQIALYLDS